jgi:hypothetical protein
MDFTKRNKRKIKGIDMIALKNTKGKTRNGIFRENIGIRNLLIEIEGKLLQWFGNVKRIYRIGIPRRVLYVKFKE